MYVDWEANLRLCDFLNLAGTSLDDKSRVSQAIKSKLRNLKEPSVILHTLVLVETCIKNCGAVFARMMSDEQFMKLVEDLAVTNKGLSSECKRRTFQ